MLKEKIISGKDLIKLAAKKSGYHQYEVEDVLAGLQDAIQQSLLSNRAVRLDCLFTIEPKLVPPRRFMHAKTGEESFSSGTMSLSIKISDWLKREMNNEMLDKLLKKSQKIKKE